MKLRNSVIIFSMATLCCSYNLYAQELASANTSLPTNVETKLINYEKVIEVVETKKNDLFDRAIMWATDYYKNPADVIREKNPDAGKIVCKARFKISNEKNKDGIATDAGVVQYTLTLLFKEGKYKYEITEFNWKQLSYYPVERWMETSSQTYNPAYNFYLRQVDEYALKTIADLEKNMAMKKKEKKNDW